MGFLDKLDSILKLNLLPKLKNLAVNFFSNNSSNKFTIQDNRTININIAKIDNVSLKQLQSELKREVLGQDSLLIEGPAKELIEDFKKVDSAKGINSLLEFFKGKIPSNDLEILRASHYLKVVHDRGQQISKLKQDIIERYGFRGNNISNLYSAGYFESLIKPLYEEMFLQKDFSRSKFDKIYEIIVTQGLYAVFINSRMNDQEVEEKVRGKMELSKKYGIGYLNIHGLGKDNVNKIEHFVKKITPELISLPEITGGDNFITVKISF